MKLALLEQLLAARRAGNATALLTDLATGTQCLLGDPRAAAEALALGQADIDLIGQALRDDRSRTIERETGGTIFVEVWNPPTQLMLVGGVHIAQAMVPMAAALGYRVMLIDPRERFGSAERFPGVEIANEWPDVVLSRAVPDRRTAVVTLTHDAKIDDPALASALRSDAFYIGALGSRGTHAARIERLLQAGFSLEETARIRGPAGLPIGAIAPAEIAVSILAEMTAALRGKDIRERRAA